MSIFHLIWKNMYRNKVRTWLTKASIFIAFFLLGLLYALNNAFYGSSDINSTERLITIHKISLMQPLPISYGPRIKKFSNVDTVSHSTWFGGYYQESKNQFPQFPVDANSYLDLVEEIELTSEYRENWLSDKNGAIVGKPLADRFGWKPGDRVSIISTIWPKKDGLKNWEFTISGIFTTENKGFDSNVLLFHYGYFDETRAFGNGTVGWYMVKVVDQKYSGLVAQAIDNEFSNSPAETKTSTENAFAESFAKQFGDIASISTMILSVVFFTMVLVTSNDMLQSVRERIPEFGMMKALGFSSNKLLIYILVETIALISIAAVFGLLAAWLTVASVTARMNTFLPGLFLGYEVFAFGIGLTLILSIMIGLIPAMQVKRLSIIESLGTH